MRVAGVMSGTSLDGIDVAIIDIRGRHVETLAFRTTPYPRKVRESLLAVSDAVAHTGEISRLNFLLGDLYAAAIRATAAAAGISLGSVQLVGSHGQTIFHASGKHTLQIGEAAVIAERLGIPVVSDFRPADIAAGGKGAPLVPFVDQLLFGVKPRIALNIGGIANLTVLPAGIAFDTGPGNMVIDALVLEQTKGRQRFDRGGKMASRGRVLRPLLDALLEDPYYQADPPKTAGREQYGRAFLERLKASGAALTDLITTATVLTAATIATGVRRFAPNAFEIIVSGGGAHNPQILGHLAAFLPTHDIVTSNFYGIDVDAKEAVAFAILASRTWRGLPANLPSATGARRPAVLGKITRV